MISLKSLIIEDNPSNGYGGSTIGIDKNKEEVIRKNFSDIINLSKNKEVYLFRSTNIEKIPKGFEYYIISPKKINRKSKDLSNLYYVLLDNLPSWKGYPKRSNSLIFTNNLEVSDQYFGQTYQIFPINNSKIVSCQYSMNRMFMRFPYLEQRLWHPFDDIWVKYRVLFYELYKLDKKRFMEFGLLFSSKEQISTNNYKQFIEIGNRITIDDLKKINETPNDYVYIIRDMINNLISGNIEEYFDKLLNPEKNGVELYKTYNLRSEDGEREMWTDGTCLMKRYHESGPGF